MPKLSDIRQNKTGSVTSTGPYKKLSELRTGSYPDTVLSDLMRHKNILVANREEEKRKATEIPKPLSSSIPTGAFGDNSLILQHAKDLNTASKFSTPSTPKLDDNALAYQSLKDKAESEKLLKTQSKANQIKSLINSGASTAEAYKTMTGTPAQDALDKYVRERQEIMTDGAYEQARDRLKQAAQKEQAEYMGPENLWLRSQYQVDNPLAQSILGYADFLRNNPATVKLNEHMAPELEKKREEEAKKLEDWSNERPLLSSAASVATSLLSGGDYINRLTEQAAIGKTLNTPGITATDATQAIRGGVVRDKSDLTKFLYNTAMSGVDSFVASLGSGGGAVMLGLGAASNTYNDIKARGGSERQAFVGGAVAGIFEGLFEGLSIGQLNAMKQLPIKDAKSIFGNITKSTVTNLSEEAATEIANIAFDLFNMQDLSGYSYLVRSYEAEYIGAGMSESEAKAKAEKSAKWALLDQVLQAAASGALMGATFGGGATLRSDLASTLEGRDYKDAGLRYDLVDLAMQGDKNSNSYKMAEAIGAKFDEGKADTVSARDIGRLSNMMKYEAEQKAAAEAKQNKPSLADIFKPAKAKNTEFAQESTADAQQAAPVTEAVEAVAEQNAKLQERITNLEKRAADMADEAESRAKTNAATPVDTVAQNQSESDATVQLTDGRSVTKAEFIDRYMSSNPDKSAAFAETMYADAVTTNKLGNAYPATVLQKADSAAQEGAGADARRSVGNAEATEQSGSESVSWASESAPTRVQDWVVRNINSVLSKQEGAPTVSLDFGMDMQENGYFDEDSNTIILNGNKLTTQEQIEYTLAHEMLHPAETADGGALVNDVLAFAEKSIGSLTVQSEIDDTREKYIKFFMRKDGLSRMEAEAKVSNSYAKGEVAADIMRDLMSGTGGLSRLANENKTVLERLIDVTERFLSDIKGNSTEAKALRNEAEALVDRMYRAQGLQNEKKSVTLATENNEQGGRHSVDGEAEGVQTRTSGRRLGRGGSGVHGIGYAHVQTVAEHGHEGQQKDISNDELKRAAVTPDDSSGAKRARDICVSYGVSTYVVPDSLMQAAVDNIGFAQSGEVYLSDKITTAVAKDIAIHEVIHTMLQKDFYPYRKFLFTVESRLCENDGVRKVIHHVMDHCDIFGEYNTLGDFDKLRVLDELSCWLYGRSEWGGDISKLDGRVFNDSNAFITDLRLVLDQYKAEYGTQSATETRLSAEAEEGVSSMPETDEQRFSIDDGEYAPTFYSHMERVVEGLKQDKFGASSVIPTLRNKGVKVDEIKWTGLEDFLEGKKSVTKQELLDYMRENALVLKERELNVTPNKKRTSSANSDNGIDLSNLSEEERAEWDSLNAKKESLVADITDRWDNFFDEPVPDELFTTSDPFEVLMDWFEPGDNDMFAILPLAENLSRVSARIRGIQASAANAPAEQSASDDRTFWHEYKLGGGEKYREYLYKIPGAYYTNDAMLTHWGSDEYGVLMHARVQDYTVDGKKVLFIEEIQSDWHNEGYKHGYEEGGDMFGSFYDDPDAPPGKVPDAPYKKTYQEYVLKDLLRKAAEGDYAYIAWTPSDVQLDRWNPDKLTNAQMGVEAKKPDAVAFEESYIIEYDNEIPRFLADHTKKFGGELENITLKTGGRGRKARKTVQSLKLTDTVKNAVLFDGQARYSIDSTMPFKSQVNAAIREALSWNSHRALYIRETPNMLAEVGLGDLPMAITAKHIKDITHAEEQGHPEWHGIPIGMVKRIPELLSNPVMLLDSQTAPGDVVVVTTEKDRKGRPVVITIHPNGYAWVDGKKGPANFITSMYGRGSFDKWLDENAKAGNVLYWDKKRSHDLINTGVTSAASALLPQSMVASSATQTLAASGDAMMLPSSLTALPHDTIIREHKGYVKDNIPERRFSIDRDSTYAPTFYSQMERVLTDLKQEKLDANTITKVLLNKGVKAEEIKWTGVEEFIEGKKSVTKSELLDFIRNNQLEIEEVELNKDAVVMESDETGELFQSFEDFVSSAEEYADYLGRDPEAVRFDTPTDGYWVAYIHDDETGDDDVILSASSRGSDETRWSDYSTDGGTNYREYLFKIPGSEYTNQSMKTHWVGHKGVLAHARVQDFTVGADSIMFVEEIQSDWHNEGHKKGYADSRLEDASLEYEEISRKLNPTPEETARLAELGKILHPARTEVNQRTKLLGDLLRTSEEYRSIRDKIVPKIVEINKQFGVDINAETALDYAVNAILTSDGILDLARRYDAKFTGEENARLTVVYGTIQELNTQRTRAAYEDRQLRNRPPEAPYSKNYHEFVLKNLLRKAAEGGYSYLAWTPGKMQEERWSSEYAEGYRIEYDQDIPKFLNKFGKKFGAKVTTIQLDENYDQDYVDGQIRTLERDRAEWEEELEKPGASVSSDFIQSQIAFINKEIEQLKQAGHVWAIPITDAMRKSVLYEGQPRYSVDKEAKKTKTGGNTGNVNPDTGYERGSVADSFMRIWNTGDREAALSVLEQTVQRLSEMQAEQAEKRKSDTLSATFRPAGQLTEDVIARNKRVIEELIAKYGKMEQTSAAQQEVRLPKQRDDKTKTRGFIQTAAAAEVTNEAVLNEFERAIVEGDAGATYVPIGDKGTLRRATEALEKEGFEELFRQWEGKFEAGDAMTKDDIAKAEQLYVEACNNRDTVTAMKLAAQIAVAGTQAGQTVQAMTLLKKMTPSGNLYYIQKAVDRLNKNQNGKHKDITINEQLAKKLLEAETQEEIQAALNAICQDLADQMPVTLMDKWNTWRYLAMLGNPRTHIRNLLGNAVFTPARLVKDVMGAGAEKLLPQDQRTKAIRVSAELRDFAKQDAEVMKDTLRGGGKYNPADMIRDKRRIFRSGALNAVEQFNSAMLEAEDWLFLKSAYASALSGFLSARGATTDAIAGANSTQEGRKLLEEARAYAVHEAQKATYRDMSKIANELNHFKRSHRVAGALLDGAVPFTKTPINIVKRGVEYSPAGLIKGVVDMGTKVRKGDMGAAEALDEMCAGLTGTGVLLIGALLTKMGVLVAGHGDDDDDEFEELQGVQEYSLRLGDRTYTIDWTAPVALPLFVGSEIYSVMSADADYDVDAMDAILDGLTTMFEPMLSLSMLDGLNKTLSANKYGEEDDALYNILATVATSYVSQGVPTLFGQIARTVDDSRRVSFTPKGEGKIASWLSRAFQTNVQGKIPVAAGGRMLYIDNWGRADTESSVLMRLFENFISPSYISEVKTTAVDAEIERLAKATNDNGVYPDKAAKYFSVDKETYAMSQEEYQAHLIERGQRSYKMVSDIINSPAYAGLDDVVRAQAITLAYDYASGIAKLHTNSAYDTDKWMLKLYEYENAGGDVAEYLLLRAQSRINDVSLTETALSDKGITAATVVQIAVMETNMPDSFADPRTAGYEYILSDEHEAKYEDFYSKYLAKEYSYLIRNRQYQNASAAEKYEMFKDIKNQVGKKTREAMSDWLRSRGIKPTPTK